jgi:hypothetical protein
MVSAMAVSESARIMIIMMKHHNLDTVIQMLILPASVFYVQKYCSYNRFGMGKKEPKHSMASIP